MEAGAVCQDGNAAFHGGLIWHHSSGMAFFYCAWGERLPECLRSTSLSKGNPGTFFDLFVFNRISDIR